MPRKKYYKPRPPEERFQHFTEPQRLLIIQWIAEGLKTKEINERAAAQKPPFVVTANEIYYYRITREVDIQAARLARVSEVVNTGFALRENRVLALNNLAERIYNELMERDKLWLPNAKGIGSGPDYERIDYEDFNRAGVEAVRGILEDLAQELGERVRRTDITSKDKPLPSAGPVISAEALKNLTDDELSILERAAEILERKSGGPAPKQDSTAD